MNGGLASSVEGVPGEESVDASGALTRNGTVLGAFFLRSINGLMALDESDGKT